MASISDWSAPVFTDTSPTALIDIKKTGVVEAIPVSNLSVGTVLGEGVKYIPGTGAPIQPDTRWDKFSIAKDDPQEPNFMPYSEAFEATEMCKRIRKRLPVIQVAQLMTDTISETLINTLKQVFDSVTSGAKTIADNVTTGKPIFDGFSVLDGNVKAEFSNTPPLQYGADLPEGSFKPISQWWWNNNDKSEDPLTMALYLLFMTFSSHNVYKYNLPIMASPQIDIKTGSGWEKSTSIFPLATKLASSVLGSSAGGVAGSVSSLLSYLGQDIAVGPIFSTKGVMENNPSFTSETVFINDSASAAKKNKIILQQLMIGALPGANGLLNIKPGSLFNVSVNVGLGTNGNDTATNVVPLKKLFLCTGDFTVTTHGIYRDGVTPEAYKLKTTFTSLLPDFINMQMLNFATVNSKGTTLLGLKSSTNTQSDAKSIFSAVENVKANAGKTYAGDPMYWINTDGF